MKPYGPDVVETEHVLPTPWAKDEAERLAHVEKARAEFIALGGQIIEEHRVRNIAFDRRGERTTWKFRVRWP